MEKKRQMESEMRREIDDTGRKHSLNCEEEKGQVGTRKVFVKV